MTANGPARQQIAGVLLGGGRSSRMFPESVDAGDKGLLSLAGTTMLEMVAAKLRPHVAQLVLNANGDPSRFVAFSLPVAADTVTDYAGPLAGLLAGMRWALVNAPQATHIATAPLDCPFMPNDVVTRLSAGLGRHTIALAASRGRTHPVIGLWPVSLTQDLDTALNSGTRAMMAWIARHDTAIVSFSDVEIGTRSVDPFFNVNTPEELIYARALLAQRPPAIAIVGWKNTGKTTLACALIAEFTRRGLCVASIKHAHHDLALDDAGTDSARHREAGACEVAAVGPNRRIVGLKLYDGPQPAFEEIRAMLAPSDLVIVEGYKREPIAKIEVRARLSRDQARLSALDPHVLAVASDDDQPGESLPVFARSDIAAIADFIAVKLGL